MTNLLAICRPSENEISIKRVEISQPVQNLLGGLFQQQATAFLEGIEEDVEFGGDYKPDADEMLFLNAANEIAVLREAAENPINLNTINADNYMTEGIRGLFISAGSVGHDRFLIQSFNAQQFLARERIALIFQGDTFRQLTEPSFALDNKLVAIVENGRLRFRSFHLLKRIFVLGEVYREASDAQIDTFCAHPSLSVPDVAALKVASGPVVRRLIHAVQAANVLDQNSVADIHAKALDLGVQIAVEGGRIVMPIERQELRYLLRFLDDAIYEGPISARRLLANSKRAFGA